jgi:uncharacterized membrane protein HdeD (DUF308 family)
MAVHPLHTGLDGIRHIWGWLFFIGTALVVLGILALLAPWFATLFLVLMYGWLLVFGGVFEIIAAYWARPWSGFILHLIFGILSFVVGALLVFHPTIAAEVLTLLLAVFFLVAGLFRICAALIIRIPGWGWALFGGIITTLLGTLIWAQWPSSALWIIGLFIGIELVFRGWALMIFALSVRQITGPAA